MLVAEAPGEVEEMYGEPLVGPSGQEERRICRDAGIRWDSVARANVSRFRPLNNRFEAVCFSRAELTELKDGPSLIEVYRGRFLHPALVPEVMRLKAELETYRPYLVIALGAVSMAILTGQVGIGKSRGTVTPCTLVPGIKVVGTFHPANILRQWKNRVIAVADHMKAKRESQFRKIVRPARKIWIEPTIKDLQRFEARAHRANLITFDVETAPRRGLMTCIGFALDHQEAIVIPWVDKRKPGYSYWISEAAEILAWRIVKRILENPVPKLGQNGLYDIQWCWRYGIRVRSYLEDTMLLHHALLPEMPKGLAFMGSVYTDEASWKLYAPRKYGKTAKLDDE